MERLRIRKPTATNLPSILVNGRATEDRISSAERQQTDVRRHESWIRELKVRLQLVLRRVSPDGGSPATSDTPSKVTSNAASNSASESRSQEQHENQWIEEVAVSSEKVYCIPDSNIFVALPNQIPVPPEAKEIFVLKIKSSLVADLELAKKKIETTSTGRRDPNNYVFEPVVLRMSGKATGGRDGTVKLSPTIWVRCSPAQHTHMKQALRESCMKWVHNTEFGEVMASAAQLLSTESPNPDKWEPSVSAGVAVDSSEGLTLHIEVEDPSPAQTCLFMGLCAGQRSCKEPRSAVRTFAESVASSLSTILYWASQQHTVYSTAYWKLSVTTIELMVPVFSTRIGRGPSEMAHPVDSLTTIPKQAARPETTTAAMLSLRLKPAGSAKPSQPVKWVETHLGGASNFIGLKAIPVTDGDNTPSTILLMKDSLKSDFALIKWEGPLWNEVSAASPTVKRICAACPIPPGPVEILLGEEMSLDGFLLEEPTKLEILGVYLVTRIVQLARPLG
ncbi:hypothetical protein MFIFM68171_07959 [Madurella fahalii]|uniref:Uncharacterized protein n=1 Tax=Madurella fahalii TaxID=1157608 RepID=A0ABQ0GIZ9_9PEZI